MQRFSALPHAIVLALLAVLTGLMSGSGPQSRWSVMRRVLAVPRMGLIAVVALAMGVTAFAVVQTTDPGNAAAAASASSVTLTPNDGGDGLASGTAYQLPPWGGLGDNRTIAINGSGFASASWLAPINVPCVGTISPGVSFGKQFGYESLPGSYSRVITVYSSGVCNGSRDTVTVYYDVVVPPTPIDISINDVSLNEGDAGTMTFQFTITATPAPANSIDVDVDTSGGSATSGTDFTAVNTTVTIPTSGSVTVDVDVNGDTVVELDETFTVALSSPVPSNAATDDPSIGVSPGTGTIQNDDSATLTIDDVSMDEGDSGTTIFIFTLRLDNPVDVLAVSVRFDTSDGSATAPADYRAIVPSSLFFSGQKGLLFVSVAGENLVELDETFFVNLGAISAGGRDVTYGDNQGEGTIVNDDAATVSIDDVSLAEGDAGTTTFSFTISLDNPVDVPVMVDVDTADAAALAGLDYTAVAGGLATVPALSLGTTIDVPVIGENLVELDENFFVDLSNIDATGRDVTFGDDQGEGTVVNDDVATQAPIFDPADLLPVGDAPIFLDEDQDNIEDGIDTQPGVFSNDFVSGGDPFSVGGTGTVLDRGDQALGLEIAGFNSVQISSAGGGAAPALIEIDGVVLSVGDGDSLVVSPGSVVVAVAAGPVEAGVAGVSVSIPADTTATIDDLGDGSVSVSNAENSAAALVVTIDGQDDLLVLPGESWTVGVGVLPVADVPLDGLVTDLIAGVNLVGWISAPTTSAALLGANPALTAIWVLRAGDWIVDAEILPASLRPNIVIAPGDGLFIVVVGAASIEADPVDLSGIALPTLTTGLNLLGWTGGSTTAADLIAANAAIDTLWVLINGEWLLDSPRLPDVARTAIDITAGTGIVIGATTGVDLVGGIPT